ncbi:MAG: uridine kinase [bacterium]|jgi:uridine kinase
MPHARPYVVGFAGGTNSGKSTFVRNLVESIGLGQVAVLRHDVYYRHRPELSFDEREQVNYDHPDSLETDLFLKHLKQLRARQAVEQPIYDFAQHLRSSEVERVSPAPLVFVEGILVLHESRLRALMDLKVFLDVDADVRLLRRINRDIAERGRTLQSVTRQYQETVRPMHERFVQPSCRHADLVVLHGGENQPAAQVLLDHLNSLVSSNTTGASWK